MGLVLGLCDRIVVIDFGRVIASGTPDEIRDSRPVVEAYLGSHGGDRERHLTGPVRVPGVEVEASTPGTTATRWSVT